jgi:hypothetical protein
MWKTLVLALYLTYSKYIYYCMYPTINPTSSSLNGRLTEIKSTWGIFLGTCRNHSDTMIQNEFDVQFPRLQALWFRYSFSLNASKFEIPNNIAYLFIREVWPQAIANSKSLAKSDSFS